MVKGMNSSMNILKQLADGKGFYDWNRQYFTKSQRTNLKNCAKLNRILIRSLSLDNFKL